MSKDLLPLSGVIKKYNLMAKKSLGQNFLLDINLTSKIVRCAGDLSDKNIIEIGPGPGGLTRALLETNAKHIYAIEKDDRCVNALEELSNFYPNKLTIKSEDALKFNIINTCNAPRVVIANLPYNIATPILIGLLKEIENFESLTLMFQKEVADRITSNIRSKTYGRLSIISQWLCHVESKFDIAPSAFIPPPKITSTVVYFSSIKNRNDNIKFETMEKLTAAAFGQRRKMLRKSLQSLNIDTNKLLSNANINPQSRAEEINIEGFINLAKEYQKIAF